MQISRLGVAASLALIGASASAQTGPFRLNDTGMQLCIGSAGAYTSDCAGSGQDAAHGRDVSAAKDGDGHAGFKYVKLGGDGATLPRTAKDWRCVADKVTGLVWEVKADNGGMFDKDKNFSNWGDGSAADSSTLVAEANARAICGATDWRMPTVWELQSLIDYGATGVAAIDEAWFPNSRDWWYWAGTDYATDPNAAWAVYFSSTAGGDGGARRDFKLSVRLVHGTPPSSTTPRYSFAGDEVTDSFTQLTWKRCALGQTFDGSTCNGTVAIRQWPEALKMTQAEVKRSGQPWRLPNAKELSTTADRTRKGPAIDQSVFPNVLAHQWYWTSTPSATDPTYVWTMDFEGGYTQTYPGQGYDLGIRLVRDAK